MEHLTVRRLARQGFTRFRASDGFSFARALAYQVVLTSIPALIVVVAVAQQLGSGGLQDALRRMADTVAPGPAGEVIRVALEQGSQGSSTLAVIVTGGLALLISGVSATAQLQRAASRIYGVEEDRPSLRRYLVATGLMLSVGLLLGAGFVLLTVGDAIGSVLPGYETVWAWGRWPAGLVVALAALVLLFKVAPNRSQPSMGWLMTGAIISVVAWVVVTVALGLYLAASGSFGDTYGPLAGIVGLLIWAYLSSIAVLLGLAYAAQLEAHRAGRPEPRSILKQSVSGPGADDGSTVL